MMILHITLDRSRRARYTCPAMWWNKPLILLSISAPMRECVHTCMHAHIAIANYVCIETHLARALEVGVPIKSGHGRLIPYM